MIVIDREPPGGAGCTPAEVAQAALEIKDILVIAGGDPVLPGDVPGVILIRLDPFLPE